VSNVKDTRDVIGLNVFSTQEGRILGRTSECVVDLASGKVLGLVVELRSGGEMGVARGDISTVGQDAVMVTSDQVMKPLAELPDLEEHRTVGKAPQVLTRSGLVLGTLGVVRVDAACVKVESYEIVGDVVHAIADGPATLGITKGTVHGRDAVVLPDEATKAITRPGGLRASWGKAVGVVREKAGEVSDKLSDAAKKARTAGGTAGEKAYARAKGAAKEARQAVEKRVDALKAKPGAVKAEPAAPAKKAPAKARKAAPKKAAAKKAPAKKRAAKKSS
jgi:uncharacterized protein YrrD